MSAALRQETTVVVPRDAHSAATSPPAPSRVDSCPKECTREPLGVLA